MDNNGTNNQNGGKAPDMSVDVTIWPVRDNKNLLAFADVTLNDSLVVKGIKICTGEKGDFVAMPSVKAGGEYRDTAFPITAEFREKIIDAVMAEYANPRDISEIQSMAAARTAQGAPETNLGVSINLSNRIKNVKANVDVTLNKCFVVKGLKVCDSKNGLFVNMPSMKDGDGGFRDSAFPITKEFREQLNNTVLEKYSKVAEKAMEKAEKKPSILGEVDKHKQEYKREDIWGRNITLFSQTPHGLTGYGVRKDSDGAPKTIIPQCKSAIYARCLLPT
jgi:DNA-binding cell septation regulator SpoVG